METYRDQWETAANVLRSHAAQFDEMARQATERPTSIPTTRDMKVAVCEYLLSVNREMDDGSGRMFIAPTAINWLGDGIVDAVLDCLKATTP